MDDDDEYLYGTSQPEHETVPQPELIEKGNPENGVVAHLENMVEESESQEGQETEEDKDDVEVGEESEEDVEIIMEPVSRSMDFRKPAGVNRIHAPGITTALPKASSSTLTTEYMPIQRGGAVDTSHQPLPAAMPFQTISQPPRQPPDKLSEAQEVGVDPLTLPPVTAPPSHPTIDPNSVGVFDGRSILEVDLNSMAEKPWRRPGSDISDWFNYGFDEISWEAYCYRRRDLGEMANVLKTNVLNFSGMPEDQLTAMPPEVRTMVMTGTTTMMNQGASANMMTPGVMMDMSGMMGPMGMGIGIGGDISMGGAMVPMQDGQAVTSNGTSDQVAGNLGMIQDGFNGSQTTNMMNISMSSAEYGMQDQNAMNQQIYPGVDGATPVASAQSTGVARGMSPVAYRGRVQGMTRGRGFPTRGRGRGAYGGEVAPPVRPASPLPPGVPTGPRNQNKYKDRDGNAPALDGLDYGKDFGVRTPSGEPEDRNCRKRRPSPSIEDGRGSKRR